MAVVLDDDHGMCNPVEEEEQPSRRTGTSEIVILKHDIMI
jgi:hypothetical protein